MPVGSTGLYVVHCWDCGHSGPAASRPSTARDLWNAEKRDGDEQ